MGIDELGYLSAEGLLEEVRATGLAATEHPPAAAGTQSQGVRRSMPGCLALALRLWQHASALPSCPRGEGQGRFRVQCSSLPVHR